MTDSDTNPSIPPVLSGEDPDTNPIRLSIRHVMTWTALCAVCMAGRDIWNLNAIDSRVLTITNSLYALWAGTALMGGTLFLEYRFRKKRFLNSPGSWILVANGLVTSVVWLDRCFFYFVGEPGFGIDWIAAIPLSIVFGACVVLYGFAYLNHKTIRGWNSFFAILAVRSGLTAPI
ncbi:hypothetical protein ACFL2H_04385, partial [Planctomycetota bacterium]